MTALQLEVLEAFRAINRPEDKVAKAAAALSSAYAKFETDIGTSLHTRDANMSRDLSEVRIDLSETRRDVAELHIDLSETRRDVAELRSDLTETRRDVAELRNDVTGIKLEIAGLKGEVSLQRWMLGFNITLTLLGFGSVLGFLWRFVK